MYEAHFQLHERPFSSVPQVGHYFPAQAIEKSRQAIVDSIDRQAGPLMVVGPVGSGKTMLLRLVAEHYREQFRVVTLPSARLATRKMLLQALLYELDLDYRDMDEGELRLALIDHLMSEIFCPRGVLLLVDEADSLPMMLLEELRILTNLIREARPCVQTVIFGTSRLEERFAHPRLESLNQRIAGRYYLENYSLEQSRAYIQNRMSACGRPAEDVFATEAIEAAHEVTDGIPRLINQLCQHALVLATAGGAVRIDEQGIREAWADLQQLPAPAVDPSDDASLAEAGIIEFGVLSDIDDESETTVEENEQAELLIRPESTASQSAEQDEPPDSQTVEGEPVELETSAMNPDAELIVHGPHDPFDEDFEEEEIVVDVRTSPAELARRDQRTVLTDASEQLASRLNAVLDHSTTTEEFVEDETMSERIEENATSISAASSESAWSPPESPQRPCDPVMPEPIDEAILAAVRETQRDAAIGLFPEPTETLNFQTEEVPIIQAAAGPGELNEPIHVIADTKVPEVETKQFGQLFSKMLQKG